MIQIRKGVFETNSSSSHSIVMMKNDKPTEDKVDPDYRVDNDGVLDFWYEPDLEFERSPFELLTDWYGRLRYCIATYSEDDNKIKELEEICRRRVDRFKRFKFKKDHWENKENRGYIDHQSMAYSILLSNDTMYLSKNSSSTTGLLLWLTAMNTIYSVI